jgi:hypothetical protein
MHGELCKGCRLVGDLASDLADLHLRDEQAATLRKDLPIIEAGLIVRHCSPVAGARETCVPATVFPAG